MKLPKTLLWLVALAATPALAHHSFAMFDNGRSLTLEGKVTKYQWTNPHGYIGIDARTDGGEIKHYTLELTSINMLSRAGWTSRSVKAGDDVTAIVAPLRDGRAGGLLLELRFDDGRKLVTPVPNAHLYKRTP
jgi:hypothetical protein